MDLRPPILGERQLRDLERAIQETPQVEPPLPRWTGMEQRQRRDRTHRLLQLRRHTRLTAAERAELAKLSNEEVA